MKKIFILMCLMVCMLANAGDIKHSYRPKEGFVSTDVTAKLIAEAVLVPIYGKNEINSQKPFIATLKDNVWIVVGAAGGGNPGSVHLGGSFMIHISKITGEILLVTHSK